MMNLGRIWKEPPHDLIEVLSQYLAGWTEENNEDSGVVSAGVRTRNLVKKKASIVTATLSC
jgi:hypothetical protein